MSVEFCRESPGKFDSRTLNRKTLRRRTWRKCRGHGSDGGQRQGLPPIVYYIVCIVCNSMVNYISRSLHFLTTRTCIYACIHGRDGRAAPGPAADGAHYYMVNFHTKNSQTKNL